MHEPGINDLKNKGIRFSGRVLNVEESPTFALEKKADELDGILKKEGRSVIRFGIGQPDFDTPENIKSAAKLSIDQNKTRYTASTGIKELKEAILKKFERDNGLSYELSEILVGNGAKQVLDDIMRVFINRGDRVIIPKPFWVSYSQQVILSEGIPEFVNFKDGLSIDVGHFSEIADKYGSAAGDGTAKLFILNSPSNPTGVVCRKNEIEKIGEICLKNGIFIISDEVYEKFLYGDAKHYSIAALSTDLKAKTISINAVSKTYAMTGWRIGYCAADREIIKQMTKVQDQSTSNPCTPAQWAAIEALDGNQASVELMRKEYEKRRDYIYKRLAAIKGMECVLPEGAFYVFPKVSSFFDDKIKGSFDFAGELLLKAAVAVVPGGAFGDNDYIRISYATSLEKIKEGMDRIEDFCAKLPG